MRGYLVAASLLLAANAAVAKEGESYASLMDEARTAFVSENWPVAQDALDAAQRIRPYSLYLTRNRILVRAVRDDFDGALSIMRVIADRGLSLTLPDHPAVKALREQTDFKSIEAQMAANLTPAGQSKTIVEIPDDALLPESLAVRGKQAFLVGSVRTGDILTQSGDRFAAAAGGVYALEIHGDTVRAAVNTSAPYRSPSNPPEAAILTYSLSNGALLQKTAAPDHETLIGDIEATPVGIIASDSKTPRIFIARKDEEQLDVLTQDPRFVNLQGVAYDGRRRTLFVADYLTGLFAVDPGTGEVTAIANDADAHLGGIDGLYIHKGDLIAIQNGTTPQRIIRLKLNRKGDAVKSLDVLARNQPAWNEPTNGEVVGDTLYYIATSNWPAYDSEGEARKGVARAPVRIMSIDLNR